MEAAAPHPAGRVRSGRWRLSMPDTEARGAVAGAEVRHPHHEVHSPPRVVVRGSDMHSSDADLTSEQTAHAYETSQAEGDRDDED